MTDEQMAAKLRAEADGHGYDPDVDLLRAAAARLSQSCATCAHVDTENSPLDGWALCAAPADPLAHGAPRSVRYPFRYLLVPLRERCHGWTATEGE